MMDVLGALATYLDSLGLVDFQPSGIGGDLFLETMPSTPDEAVALTGYGGPESNAGQPWDSPRVQIRVRGTQDPRVSRERCQDISDALHGLSNVAMPPLWVTSCVTLQSYPQSMGKDANNRFEHVVNVELEVRNPART